MSSAVRYFMMEMVMAIATREADLKKQERRELAATRQAQQANPTR